MKIEKMKYETFRRHQGKVSLMRLKMEKEELARDHIKMQAQNQGDLAARITSILLPKSKLQANLSRLIAKAMVQVKQV